MCIVNNKWIEEKWIIKEKKLCKRINKGGIREGSELRGEGARIAKVRRKILAREDIPIEDEVNDAETNLFILKEKKCRWPSAGSDNNIRNTSKKFVAIPITKKNYDFRYG